MKSQKNRELYAFCYFRHICKLVGRKHTAHKQVCERKFSHGKFEGCWMNPTACDHTITALSHEFQSIEPQRHLLCISSSCMLRKSHLESLALHVIMWASEAKEYPTSILGVTVSRSWSIKDGYGEVHTEADGLFLQLYRFSAKSGQSAGFTAYGVRKPILPHQAFIFPALFPKHHEAPGRYGEDRFLLGRYIYRKASMISRATFSRKPNLSGLNKNLNFLFTIDASLISSTPT